MMLHSLRLRILWTPLLLLLLIALLTGMIAGLYPITLSDLMASLWQGHDISGETDTRTQTLHTVIWNLRLPRVAAACLVGASLAAAGATYQGIFRNPLVSPDILGVSAGAGLGAVLGIFLGLPMFLVQIFAFAGGLAAVTIVYLISLAVKRHDSVLVLILAGVAISTLLGAGISLLKILADPYTQLPSITFWLLGGLNSISSSDITYMLPSLLAGLLPLLLLRWRVNLLSLSDNEALSLGISPNQTRLIFIIAATLMTSSTVAFTGIIGWVGLLIPHVARLLAGPNFSRLLPASLVLGAAFLVAADTLARTVAAIELPLGILTAMVGAPFFLLLLMQGNRT